VIFSADLVLPITAEPIKNAAVLVRDGRIAAVGLREEIVAENSDHEEVRFNNSLIMPGLVNLHGHIECSSFGYLAKPSAFNDWLSGIIEASSKLDRDGWLAASREGVKRYLEAGITCTADITRSGTGLQALLEAGMPAVVFLEAVAVDRRNLADAVVNMLERIKSAKSMVDAGRLKIGLSPHSTYTLSEQALRVFAQIAEQFELPLTIHLAETQDEVDLIGTGSGLLAERIGGRLEIEAINNGGTGETPAEFLLDKGLFQDGLIAAHGVWLSDDDIELLKKRGVAVAVCPTSNELLNTGSPPVTKFIERGLRFGIGTDSAASNPDMDLFLEARKTAGIVDNDEPTDKTLSEEALLENEQAGRTITPEQVVSKMTIEAAEMLSLDEYVGSIEIGKRADMIIVDYTDIDRTDGSYNDPYAHILRFVTKSSIQSTILGGITAYRRS
jgi:5-methylthioadenosine/S-adenosylhomocysteine deaminase